MEYTEYRNINEIRYFGYPAYPSTRNAKQTAEEYQKLADTYDLPCRDRHIDATPTLEEYEGGVLYPEWSDFGYTESMD